MFVGRRFGEAEVEDFDLIAIGDEDVGGLDVAMNDAFGVGGVERVGDLRGEVENLIDRERAGTGSSA